MADEPLGDMPEDPFPDVRVTTINMDDVAVMVIVDKSGHLTYRSSANRAYVLYAMRSVIDHLERSLSEDILKDIDPDN